MRALVVAAVLIGVLGFAAAPHALAGPIPPFPLTGQSWTFQGEDGTVYQMSSTVSVIALPTPTPTPTPAPTPAPVILSYDDTAFTYFGTWAVSSAPAKYLGTDHYSTTVGAEAGFLFTGTEVRLYGGGASYTGIASVSVDGGPATDVDTYSPVRVDNAPLFYSGPLDPGAHRILVTVTGRKNPSATGTFVSLDRAEITDGTLVAPLAP